MTCFGLRYLLRYLKMYRRSSRIIAPRPRLELLWFWGEAFMMFDEDGSDSIDMSELQNVIKTCLVWKKKSETSRRHWRKLTQIGLHHDKSDNRGNQASGLRPYRSSAHSVALQNVCLTHQAALLLKCQSESAWKAISSLFSYRFPLWSYLWRCVVYLEGSPTSCQDLDDMCTKTSSEVHLEELKSVNIC